MNALTPLAVLDFDRIMPAADIGMPGELKWIPIGQLFIDPSYQRPILSAGRASIRRMVEQFAWPLFAPVVVAPRGPGRYAIIDGQHRATAAKTHGGATSLPCLVITGGQEIEARAFAVINGMVTKVHSLMIFRAQLRGGDKASLAIADACAAAGVTIAPFPKTDCKVGETLAIGTISDCLRRFGREILVTSLETITRTGNGNAGLLREGVILGTCDVLAGNKEWLNAGTKLFGALNKTVGVRDLYKLALSKKGAAGTAAHSVRSYYADVLRAHLTKVLGPGTPAAFAPKVAEKPLRRFTDHAELDPENVKALADDHPAVVNGRTLFPSTVVEPRDSQRVLVSGANSRKLGDRVTKGPWSGFAIYQLSLEERATCPRSCHVYSVCYGNGMQLARRHRHGPELLQYLAAELADLQAKHPGGFVVRLHVLGDFYSVDYVAAWSKFLVAFPALHIFGYTAWPRDSEIGKAIGIQTDANWSRFAIRFSSAVSRPQGATTIWRMPEDDTVPEGIVCPAQTGKTDCCGTCGMCWSAAARDKTIAFIGHGPKFAGRPPAQAAASRVRRLEPASAELSQAAQDMLKKPAIIEESPVKISTPLVRKHAGGGGMRASEPRHHPHANGHASAALALVGDPAVGRSVFDKKRAIEELEIDRYLVRKGHDVRVYPSGQQFMVDGRILDLKSTLDLVNKYRARAEIPLIQIARLL